MRYTFYEHDICFGKGPHAIEDAIRVTISITDEWVKHLIRDIFTDIPGLTDRGATDEEVIRNIRWHVINGAFRDFSREDDDHFMPLCRALRRGDEDILSTRQLRCSEDCPGRCCYKDLCKPSTGDEHPKENHLQDERA